MQIFCQGIKDQTLAYERLTEHSLRKKSSSKKPKNILGDCFIVSKKCKANIESMKQELKGERK